MKLSSAPIVEIKGLTKVYVTPEVETHALANIDLEVSEGEFLSISGPSGSGKSTLLSILGLLDRPTSGKYLLLGSDVSQLSARERARQRNRTVGFIFQTFNLIGDLTVEENVDLPLRYRKLEKAERRRRVQEAIERVGMGDRRRHYPAQLSGGQQQRVAVARAVAGEPPLLLADEPTGNLDSQNGEAVLSLLAELHQQGSTICMVTHNANYDRCASRVIHLADGHIVEAEGALRA